MNFFLYLKASRRFTHITITSLLGVTSPACNTATSLKQFFVNRQTHWFHTNPLSSIAPTWTSAQNMSFKRHIFVKKITTAHELKQPRTTVFFKTVIGHMVFFCQECWNKASWSSRPEGGCKYTRVMVRSIRHGPIGHTWLHQSFSVFEECTGPPERGIGRENLNMALKTQTANHKSEGMSWKGVQQMAAGEHGNQLVSSKDIWWYVKSEGYHRVRYSRHKHSVRCVFFRLVIVVTLGPFGWYFRSTTMAMV